MQNKQLKDAHALAVATTPLDYSIIYSNYNACSDGSLLLWLKGLYDELTKPTFDTLLSSNSEYKIIREYIVEKYVFLFEYSRSDREIANEVWDLATDTLIRCVANLISLGDSVSSNSIRRHIQTLIDAIDGDRYLVTSVYAFVDQNGVISSEFFKEAVFDCIEHATRQQTKLLERREKKQNLEPQPVAVQVMS